MRIPLAMMALLSALLLSGCAGQSANKKPEAWLRPGTSVTLPPPGIEPEIEQQQLLTVSVRGQQHSLLVLLKADGEQLTLAGLSPLGIRLFKLTYTQSGISVEQSIVLPQLPPSNQVLADIMLSYWPLAVWQERLPEGWRLVDEQNMRTLYDAQGEAILDIRYATVNGKRQPDMINHHIFHYRILVQNVGSPQ